MQQQISRMGIPGVKFSKSLERGECLWWEMTEGSDILGGPDSRSQHSHLDLTRITLTGITLKKRVLII